MTQATGGPEEVMALALATGLFVSTCDIQEPSGFYNAAGAPDGTYVNVAGLTSITCMRAPISKMRIRADEKNSIPEILSVNESHVLLGAYHPAIQTNWRAVVDSVAYDIKGVEHDSQLQMSRLRVALVSL